MIGSTALGPQLRSFPADEKVVGGPQEWDVWHFGDMLFKKERVKVPVQKGNVVG